MFPFECREISTFREVWTLLKPFLEGNSKSGLREAVDQAPYCQYQRSVVSSTRKWRRRYTWKCTFMCNCPKFKWSVTLTLDRVKVTATYTVYVGLPAGPTTLVRICGRGLPTHQIRWKSEKLFVDVRTDGRTDGRTHLSSNLLGHRRGDDLIKLDYQCN